MDPLSVPRTDKNQPGLIHSIRSSLKPFALGLKLAGIFLIVLLLQIPLVLIGNLLDERNNRRAETIEEITSTWGKDQTIVGPVLVVPYRTMRTVEKETVVNGHTISTKEEHPGTAYAFFLPENLHIEGELNPSLRHRGIHDAVVYTSRIKMHGHFAEPDFKQLGTTAQSLQWNLAWVAFGISDLRGTQETLKLVWDGQPLPLNPGTRLASLETGLHAVLPAERAQPPAGTRHDFSLEFNLNGSGALQFAPLGVETTVSMQSAWPDPSFCGAFLPTERQVTPGGFNALWKIPYYVRNYGQQWLCLDDRPAIDSSTMEHTCFGVNLSPAVDSYRLVERSSKHGALFITLLFTAFFLFEVLCSLRLHVLHYLLVGSALCLFYLGLLSLSEFFAFGAAYLASAGASILLIGLYCRSILKSGARSLLISTMLLGIYGFLYFVLQMQDYALLAGSAVLFVLLAAVMYTTRRVDWSEQSMPNLSQSS